MGPDGPGIGPDPVAPPRRFHVPTSHRSRDIAGPKRSETVPNGVRDCRNRPPVIRRGFLYGLTWGKPRRVRIFRSARFSVRVQRVRGSGFGPFCRSGRPRRRSRRASRSLGSPGSETTRRVRQVTVRQAARLRSAERHKTPPHAVGSPRPQRAFRVRPAASWPALYWQAPRARAAVVLSSCTKRHGTRAASGARRAFRVAPPGRERRCTLPQVPSSPDRRRRGRFLGVQRNQPVVREPRPSEKTARAFRRRPTAARSLAEAARAPRAARVPSRPAPPRAVRRPNRPTDRPTGAAGHRFFKRTAVLCRTFS